MKPKVNPRAKGKLIRKMARKLGLRSVQMHMVETSPRDLRGFPTAPVTLEELPSQLLYFNEEEL